MDVITHVLAMTQSMEDTNVILSKLLCSKWKNITTTVPVYTSEFEAMYLLKKKIFFFICVIKKLHTGTIIANFIWVIFAFHDKCDHFSLIKPCLTDAQDTWIYLKTADFTRTLPTPVVTLWNVLSQHLPPTQLRPLLQDNPTPTPTLTPTPTHSRHTILNHSQLQSLDVSHSKSCESIWAVYMYI